MQVQNLTPDLAKQLGIHTGVTGVVVTDVDPSSAAAEAAIQRGDVIQEVDRNPSITPISIAGLYLELAINWFFCYDKTGEVRLISPTSNLNEVLSRQNERRHCGEPQSLAVYSRFIQKGGRVHKKTQEIQGGVMSMFHSNTHRALVVGVMPVFTCFMMVRRAEALEMQKTRMFAVCLTKPRTRRLCSTMTPTR